MDQNKLAQLNQYIESADLALQQAREIMAELGGNKLSKKLANKKAKTLNMSSDKSAGEQIIEGIFNGQTMNGPDGKEYSVPANYASKSKLIEGDTLKLTIQPDGSFVYKQIKPADRERLTGKLVFDEVTGQFSVLSQDGKKYNVLTASVTYFKGSAGDNATIIIPKDKTCQWAAIENIIKPSAINDLNKPKDFDQDEIIFDDDEKNEIKKTPVEQDIQQKLNDDVEDLLSDSKKIKQDVEEEEEEYHGLSGYANKNSDSEQQKQEIENMMNNNSADFTKL